jgi:hypothetical protein
MNENIKIKHKKELKSLRNKMGKHIIWFDSLTPKKQYDVLFRWKIEKNSNQTQRTKTKKSFVGYDMTTHKKVFKDVIVYPPRLKYFILSIKKSYGFQPSKQNLRESAIDLILKIK